MKRIILLISLSLPLSAAEYSLNINTDNGYVLKQPDQEFYEEGDTVRLITRPKAGYKFSHWGGDAAGNRLIADIIMTGNKNVTAVFDMWTPPIGIPEPEFGIFETYRMYDNSVNHNPQLTYSQNAEGGYYTHYVDNTHPQATNTNNPYGTAEKPRESLPNASDIQAGSVVEVHGGPYTIGYSIFRVLGTKDMPIFIRGASADDPVEINAGNFYLNSQYVIMENFKMSLSVRSFVDKQAHHVSIRNFEAAGLSAISWDDGCSEDIVFYAIYNNSNSFDPSQGEFDESDGGGIGINLGSNRVWIIDNVITRAGGDASGGGHAANYTAQNYYIGRNIMYTCGENAIDIKEVNRAIVSENVMFNFYGWSSGSDGTAIVIHYGPTYSPKNVWILFNEIFDCSDKGIQVGGDQIYDVHIIGNVIHDIHNEEGTASAYRTWNSRKVYMVNNTFHNIDIAVNSWVSGSGAELFMYNNILSQVNENGYHLYIGGSEHMNNSFFNNNLFYQSTGDIKIKWGGSDYNLEQFIENTDKGENCIEGDPSFIDPSHCDFRLQESSSARNNGIEYQIYQIFQDTFGIDIRVDKNNISRSQNSTWDVGAYEYDGSTGITTDKNIANRFLLYQNYPNPFNPNTVISYKLNVKSEVELKIYDILGREIAILVNEVKNAGDHTVVWNGTNSEGHKVDSGVYFYRLKIGLKYSSTRKMVLIN